MFTPYFETEDGHEGHWSINFLGHALLTQLMLPILAKSGTDDYPSRIVNVSSCLHYPGSFDFEDINQK